ncbi:MAG: polysaccharide pyruvyl transferase family protein [Pseudomonadota bacterium]
MKLTYFEHSPSNFGDAINATMWAHLLPEGFFDQDESELFLGAGSILWGHTPKRPIKHVMGSGYGGYSGPPDMSDGSWNVVWVRGPLTAATLGLAPRLAIADAAVLLRETPLPDAADDVGVAFMPHFESTYRGRWADACALAGITFIDPRWEPDRVIALIRGARLIISEAMHGAIVADALRTPWVGIVPFDPAHRMKWQDWAQALDIDLRTEQLMPSSALEAYTALSGKSGKARAAGILQRPWVPRRVFLHLAAARLRRVAEAASPQLSSDAMIHEVTARCLDALHGFAKAHAPRPTKTRA